MVTTIGDCDFQAEIAGVHKIVVLELLALARHCLQPPLGKGLVEIRLSLGGKYRKRCEESEGELQIGRVEADRKTKEIKT